jgi:hypothetical protein
MNATVGSALKGSHPKELTLYLVAISLIALIYLVQLASPLRLNTDAVTLLSMACNAEDGRGFVEQGHTTQFPIGYPLVILTLIKAHLACSASFIAVNLICLAIALFQFSKIARWYWAAPSRRIACVIALFLLAFPTIKHVTIPLTEMPFAAMMMSSLRCLTEWNHQRNGVVRRSWGMLLLGSVLAVASIFIRTLGIALLPALVGAIVLDPPTKAWLLRRSKRPLTLVPILIGVVIIAGAAFWHISNTKYFRSFVAQAHQPGVLLKTAFVGRLTDATELFCNLPIEKLAHLPMVYLLGIVPVALIVLGFIRRKRLGTLEIFLLCYIGIMVIWPYRDARFWIPVLPFMLVIANDGFESIQIPVIKPFIKYVYLAVFSLAGLAALGSSTRLSIAGDRFADLYGAPATRATYQTAFGRPADPSLTPFPDWIELLQRLEPRAKHHSA